MISQVPLNKAICLSVFVPGRRAIHWAAYTGQLKSLEMLKDYKCDLHALDHEGSSALHLAAAFGDLEVVKWLVQNKVSCDLRDHRNRLPKDVARARGLVDVHHFLKQHTAKLSFVSDNITFVYLPLGALGDWNFYIILFTLLWLQDHDLPSIYTPIYETSTSFPSRSGIYIYRRAYELRCATGGCL